MADNNKSQATVPVYGLNGKEVHNLTLPQMIFSGKQSDATLQNYVRVFLTNQRKGSASTKTRSEVIGSTRKIYRQKGTGGARHGARKAPIFVGGGVTFGPKPREFSLSMTKKQKRAALITGFTQKAEAKEIIALSSEVKEMEPKTKLFAQFLKKMEYDATSVLIITADAKYAMLQRATRNIKNVTVLPVDSINAYDIISHNRIILVEDTVAALEKKFIS